MDLEQKLRDKTAAIAIIGLGYVGLPLAVEFAGKGFRVYGVDIDETTTMPEIGEIGISYDKGCYIGQEVVAKVKYIGHVNRRFVGLTISGNEFLVWRNPSDDEIRELQFHLYLNAFKNNRSLFARESGGQLRSDRMGMKPEDWGWIDVVSVRTEKNYDLKPLTRFLLFIASKTKCSLSASSVSYIERATR